MNVERMQPALRHDEKARQDFVTALRGHLAARIMPGNRTVYEKELKPAFVERHGREPATPGEVRPLMTSHPYYQFWSALQRCSQEMMWQSVIDPTERELDGLIERARELAAQRPAGGSLRLDPELAIPPYHLAADIHIQPGAYHTEYTADDVAAGVIYEGGLPIYLGGALGPESDLLGNILTRYVKTHHARLEPGEILDMGCGVGNSTLPWAKAFPQAALHGVDVAAPCLRYAHARAEAAGVAVHFSQQNAESTDFEDRSFDLVVSHIMLHETSRPALSAIFAECRRLLRPGGIMAHLEIPRGEGAFEQFMFQWETYNNNEYFARCMTGLDLPAIAVAAGFKPDDVRLEGFDAGFDEEQTNYSEQAMCWPILIGCKA